MDYQKLISLIEKMENQTASADELQRLDEFYYSFEEREDYTDHISDLEDYERVLSSRIRLGIAERVNNKKGSSIRLWSRIAVAASILLIVGLSSYFFKNRHTDIINQFEKYGKDIIPGKNGATLTLANGKKIQLSDASNGELAREAGLRISKTANGQLVYEVDKSGHENNRINILTTERGETFQLRLPDGSLIWLNSASSLTFNISLNELGKRRVRLIGEAYFEVAKDKSHPFIVETDKQEVEVLGTHFNINAYREESVNTTLLEGAVRVISFNMKSKQIILKPNQESITTSNGIKVLDVDPERNVAWKAGLFMFENENLESIMQKIARWYDVDIRFESDELKQKTFSGSFSRSANVSKVLQKIESTHSVRFTVKDRIITLHKY